MKFARFLFPQRKNLFSINTLLCAFLLCYLGAINSVIAQQSLQVRYEKYALIIGNSEYDGLFFKSLPSGSPANIDIKKVADLTRKLGFEERNIIVRANLDSANLKDEISYFFSKASTRMFELKQQRGDAPVTLILFFYFSGHGLSIQNSNYLIPRDFGNPRTYQQAKSKGFPIDQLFADTSRMNSSSTVSHVLVAVIDACRNESPQLEKLLLSAEKGFDGGNNIQATPVKMSTVPNGSVISYAAAKFKPTSDAEDGYPSPFTGVFLEEYNKDLSLTVRKLLLDKVRPNYRIRYKDALDGYEDQLQEDIALNASSAQILFANSANPSAEKKLVGKKGVGNAPQTASAIQGYVWLGNYDDNNWAPVKVAGTNAKLISVAPAQILPLQRLISTAALNIRSRSPAEAGIPTNTSEENFIGTIPLGTAFEIVELPFGLKNRRGQSQIFAKVRILESDLRKN